MAAGGGLSAFRRDRETRSCPRPRRGPSNRDIVMVLRVVVRNRDNRLVLLREVDDIAKQESLRAGSRGVDDPMPSVDTQIGQYDQLVILADLRCPQMAGFDPSTEGGAQHTCERDIPKLKLAQFRGRVNAFAGGGVEAKLLLRVRVRSTPNRLRRATPESQPEPKRNLRGPRARDMRRAGLSSADDRCRQVTTVRNDGGSDPRFRDRTPEPGRPAAAEQLKAAAVAPTTAAAPRGLGAPRSGRKWQARPARRRRGELAIGGRANAPSRHLSCRAPVRQPSVGRGMSRGNFSTGRADQEGVFALGDETRGGELEDEGAAGTSPPSVPTTARNRTSTPPPGRPDARTARCRPRTSPPRSGGAPPPRPPQEVKTQRIKN